MMLALRQGNNRAVMIIGPLAFKFARHKIGARCNAYEADLYGRTTAERRAMLCPVLACIVNGWLLIARSAQPLTAAEAQGLRDRDAFPDWDYVPPDDECPFEFKASDWGRLNGALAETERHVALGSDRIAKQKQIIADLELHGQDTTESRYVLHTFLRKISVFAKLRSMVPKRIHAMGALPAYGPGARPSLLVLDAVNCLAIAPLKIQSNFWGAHMPGKLLRLGDSRPRA